MQTRYALPLTFLFSYDQEAKAWAAIACEIDVGSCGDSIEEARDMLEDAVRTHVTSMVELSHVHDLADPTPGEDLAELLAVPPDQRAVEYQTALLTMETEPQPHVTAIEFLPTAVKPGCCPLPVAA